MSDKITFDYFYGKESEMYSFYRIPKSLFTNNIFQCLSTDAKVLYGLMLDRMSLSIKNHWIDEENRTYIYFSLEDTMEMLNCKKNKAIDTIKELDSDTGIGLIEKKRQGQGKPSIIYVKSFMVDEEETQKLEKQTSEKEEINVDMISEVGKTNFQRFEKPTSRGLKNQLLEVGKRESNNTKYNNTDNKIIISDSTNRQDEYLYYSSLIKKNISYDILLERYPYEKELVEGIFDLILEMVVCKNGTVLIAKNEYPVRLVKEKFLKLDSGHIEYVIECLKSNTTKVRNIKKYLLASLFNAPSTMAGFYRVEFNHDLPQYAN